MIKWNDEYQVYVSDDGRIYNKDMHEYYYTDTQGYKRVITRRQGKAIRFFVHRIVWETFNDKIPVGMQIDHINHLRDDNRIENLRCLTPIENLHNRLGKLFEPRTDFGNKFKEHFGINRRDNVNLWQREYYYYRRYGKCSWE